MQQKETSFKRFKCPGLEDYSLGKGEKYYGQQAFLDGKTMYLAAKMNREKKKSLYLKIPLDYNLEYRALGGTTKWERGRFLSAGYMYENIEDIQDILRHPYRDKDFALVYDCLKYVKTGESVVLCVEGPFSILCSFINPLTLVRGFVKYGNMIRKVLGHISAVLTRYLKNAIYMGITIVSYADPVGNMEFLGKKNYQKYSGQFSDYIFREIEPDLSDTCVHLCGKCSVDMEQSGFWLAENTPAYGKYGELLIEFARKKSVNFIGHGCIHCEKVPVDSIWILRRR